MKFATITDYAWEDISESTAKIYVSKDLDGIKLIDQQQVQCEFESFSVDLKIRDFKGKNWRFRVDPVHDSLAVEGCKINIKSNSITITLQKENPKQWKSLKFVKQMGKHQSQAEGSNAGEGGANGELMSLMKDLYKMGGDDMKRTISESFQTAQD
jgi:hypothetical protein